MIKDHVWIRKSDGQIGIGMAGTWLGDIFFFNDYDPNEVVRPDFCLFLDDHGLDLKRDFIDLGEL